MAGGYPPQQQPPQGYGQPQGYAPQPQVDPNAPYGIDPKTGIPYSDKQKMIAAGLQVIVPMFFGIGGIGRLYSGHVGTGVAQLILNLFCVGQIWSLIDGILMFVNDSPTDGNGRILRP
ncbi:MAG: TM2 domain-containing protein [Planctomycetes bacterium]|nr:TM2 domain-containing protein [Planctomycetota bacterium]